MPKKIYNDALHSQCELKYNELFDNAEKMKQSLTKEKNFVKGLTNLSNSNNQMFIAIGKEYAECSQPAK